MLCRCLFLGWYTVALSSLCPSVYVWWLLCFVFIYLYFFFSLEGFCLLKFFFYIYSFCYCSMWVVWHRTCVAGIAMKTKCLLNDLVFNALNWRRPWLVRSSFLFQIVNDCPRDFEGRRSFILFISISIFNCFI